MDLTKKIAALADRIESLKESVATEEATKHSFVMPFLQMLGYDIFDPTVIVPEYIADTGKRKHEKVDYAILSDGEPMILIEVKRHHENLDNHVDQLYRYFSVTNNKFAILTNGIEYRFFTESETNRMDHVPFLSINLLDPKKREIKELEKFAKDELDIDKIMSLANKRKYVNGIKEVLEREITEPSDEFAKYFASSLVDGRMTQGVVNEFKDHLKTSLREVITDIANEKLNAIRSGLSSESEPESVNESAENDGVVTTEDELTGYYIVKSILADGFDISKVAYRDNKSYFNVLYDDNNRKWICRLHFNTKQKYIGLHEVEKEETKYPVETLDDIYRFADNIRTIASRFA